MKWLRELGLARGRGALPKGLLQCCHQGRLVGALSVSLRATPDEVVGALTHAMGGEAARLKVLDVRTGAPVVMEIAYGALKEKWQLEDVSALVHNLNDLFHAAPGVKLLVVLGEWEDMLQLWALPRGVLEPLLAGRRLDDARNAEVLRRLLDSA